MTDEASDSTEREISGVLKAAMVLGILGVLLAMSAAVALRPQDPDEHLDNHLELIGPTWSTSVITVSSLPDQRWSWSVQRAIDTWNYADVDVRFVLAAPEDAAVHLEYGDTGRDDATSTIGAVTGAHITVGSRYADDPTIQAWEQVDLARLLTHELGHVLGFGHLARGCELMVSAFESDHCPLMVGPTSYACRWIDRALLAQAAAAYGGSGRLAPRVCAMDRPIGG